MGKIMKFFVVIGMLFYTNIDSKVLSETCIHPEYYNNPLNIFNNEKNL